MSSWDQCATISTLLTLSDLASPPNSSKSTPAKSTSTEETPIVKSTATARSKGYDSVCLPLTTAKWKERWAKMCLLPSSSSTSDKDFAKKRESRRESKFAHDRDIDVERKAEAWRQRPVFELGEVTMTSLDEAEGATVVVSDWLELDAPDDWVRHDAAIALQQELTYASYLNIQSAILPTPRSREHVASYARIVNSCLENTPYMHFSIRLPIYDPSVISQSAASPTQSPLQSSSSSSSSFFSPASPSSQMLDPMSPVPSTPKLVVSDSSLSLGGTGKAAEEGELDAMWEMWDVIRSICDYNTRLTLALDLTPPLPTTIGVLRKWTAEAVRYIFIPASTFIANTKGYPVLPKPTQAFIRDSMTANADQSRNTQHRPTVILSGASAGLHTKGEEAAYLQYIRHLERTSAAVQAAEKSGTVENFAQGYQDYLQAPLQPLMDNLQSITYQTFEQDPVKYRSYEEAIYRALEEWPGEDIIIICIAGAGRGPLVSRCISAIERARKNAFVYAVEKNPNAFVTLQNRKEREWGDKVKLLFGDMRYIEVPEKADILISELLGSFGDNELSPECLDGAMRFLKADGISIPSSYTAHIAPLSSSKLYNEARATKDTKSLETPYVVMFQAVNILSGDADPASGGRCGPQVQECWEFEHPRKDAIVDDRGLPLTNSHNSRSAQLTFHIPHAGVLHGLAGYFEAVLYGNIGLSIHPHRKDQISKDMLSWFPLFFPFKEPLYLPSNSELQVSIWRLTNQRQVWYEWHAESFLAVNSTPQLKDIPWAISSPNLTSSRAPSPYIDAVDMPSMDRRMTRENLLSKPGDRLVKIGQTSLHNPGGRSSWIGL